MSDTGRNHLPSSPTGKYLKDNGTWSTVSGGGSVPTGTGFRHVTVGAEDAASKLVENADVDTLAAIAQSKISGLVTDLAGKAAATHTHVIADTTALQTTLDAKSPLAHTHASADVISGTLDPARLPAATTTAQGAVELATNGESAASLAVQANDSRLSDARTPLAHSHAAADITSGTIATARLGSGTADSTTFLRGDQTWAVPAGGGGPTVARVTADVSNSTTTFQNVTGLTKSVSASTNYSFECFLSYTTAASTTALQLSINGPASPTAMRYTVLTSTTATAMHSASQSAYDTVTNPATGGGTTALPVRITGTLENGLNSGTLTIRLRSEVSSSNVTVQRGSFCIFY